ncbi:hypothetical protein FOL47_006979 [Perkinsus chesapeaki]|uniref:Peptidase A1 domain-containing protein n=1 Tax=Perkinsus chesapeaki TaxID=330153 RepID=A0A7J6N292_PERCH|nr:hypothetical protein FOL47_006979 [Perkinsus chesapeaki]
MVACAVDVVPCYGGRYSSRESYDGAGRGIRQLYSNLRELVYSRGGTTLTAKLFGHIDRYAYWFVDLLVGSPQQRTSLIVDTGSSHYHQSYTEGSSIEGYWFKDYVSLDDQDERNPPVMTKLGCHTSETKLFYTQKANGIMGMAPSRSDSRTVLDTLFNSKDNPIDKSLFSMCLATWGGELVVGGYNATKHTSSVNWAPMSTDKGFYYIDIDYFGIHLEDQSSNVSKSVNTVKDIATDKGSFGNAMVDSGTTYTYLPPEMYKGFSLAIEEACKNGACGGATSQDRKCWMSPKNDTSSFPVFRFTIGGKNRLWYPKFYMYNKADTNIYCYTVEDNHVRETVLGNNDDATRMGHDIIFDLEDRRIGWAEADCPQYVERPEHLQGVMPPWMDEKATTAPKSSSETAPTKTVSTKIPPTPPAAAIGDVTQAPLLPPKSSPPLTDVAVAVVVIIAGILILAACCVTCYGWRSRKRGGVYQLGVTQEPFSHRFEDINDDDDWSSSMSSEEGEEQTPRDIEEGDARRPGGGIGGAAAAARQPDDLLGDDEPRQEGQSSSSSSSNAAPPIITGQYQHYHSSRLVLPVTGQARITAGAAIPSVFDRKFHAADYIHKHSESTSPNITTTSSFVSCNGNVEVGAILAEMDSITLSPRTADFAMVPVRLWESLRRYLCRLINDKNAAEDEAARLNKTLKCYKELEDLELRLARLKAERIELLKDKAIIESNWASRYSLANRLSQVLERSAKWQRSLDELSTRLKVADDIKNMLRKNVEGLVTTPSVGIEPVASTMKCCEMVHRSTMRVDEKLYIMTIWYHTSSEREHSAMCPHGGTFIAPEGLIEGGVLLANAILEGRSAIGWPSSLIIIVKDTEGKTIIDEIELRHEGLINEDIIRNLVSKVTIGQDGKIDVRVNNTNGQIVLKVSGTSSPTLGNNDLLRRRCLTPPLKVWMPVYSDKAAAATNTGPSTQWARMELWGLLPSSNNGIMVLRMLDTTAARIYTLGVCKDNLHTQDEVQNFLNETAARLVGIRRRPSADRFDDIILLDVKPPFGETRTDAKLDELHTSTLSKTSLTTPSPSSIQLSIPHGSPNSVVVDRVITLTGSSDILLLRLVVVQLSDHDVDDNDAPLLADTTLYAPYQRRILSHKQLNLTELCHKMAKQTLPNTLPDLTKTALQGDWLNEKAKSKVSDELSECKADAPLLPTVTNPSPYSNDYSKFRRMEAEMKSKDEADAKKAKLEEQLQEAKERCPLDHEHGPECIEMMKAAELGGCSHDHRKEQQLYDMPTKEKLQGADTMRQKANEYLREGNLGLAAVWYRKALLNFEYCFPDTKEEREWFNSSKLKCHVSFAICKYKLEEFDEVLIQTRQALRLDPSNVKALYWQGMVYMNYKNDYKLAKASLMSAYRACPNDPGIRKALAQLKEEKHKYVSKSTKVAKTMVTSHDRENDDNARDLKGDKTRRKTIKEEEGEDDKMDSDEEGEDDKMDSDEEGEDDKMDSDEEGEDDKVDSDEEGEDDKMDSDEEGEDDKVDHRETRTSVLTTQVGTPPNAIKSSPEEMHSAKTKRRAQMNTVLKLLIIAITFFMALLAYSIQKMRRIHSVPPQLLKPD